jgi:hypothetical protein
MSFSLSSLPRFRSIMLAVLVLPLFLFAEKAKPKAISSAELDQNAIHSQYNDGDFDKVVKTIETFVSAHPTYSRPDSIFVAKHLAVVYSANPATREKGKYYMYRLLELVPSSELVDMFVSDEVDRIFDKVRKEFVLRQRNFGVDSTQMALPNRPHSDSSRAASTVAATTTVPSHNSNNTQAKTRISQKGIDPLWWWVAGGALVLGAGITAAVVLSQPDTEAGPVYNVQL